MYYYTHMYVYNVYMYNYYYIIAFACFLVQYT